MTQGFASLEPIIETHGLRKHYRGKGGVDSIDLSIPSGQIYGFVGPNGAGKTTTIRVLLGFLRAGSGCANIFGLDCWRDSHSIKRQVGYLPGDLRIYPWMTGERALRLVERIRGIDLKSAGNELAERFGLPMRQRVRTMSRGTRQKLGLVLALAHCPRLLILDEPTTGLDPPMRIELAGYLRERASAGDTVFFSSHTLAEVEQLCDRVGIVRNGCMVADESISDWRNRAPRIVTVRFPSREASATIDPPSCLVDLRRDGVTWTAQLFGPAAALMQWGATQPIDDIAIERPDLETLFRTFYRS